MAKKKIEGRKGNETAQTELISIPQQIPPQIYETCKSEINSDFLGFIERLLINIGLLMQEHKPQFSKILDEYTLRDVVLLCCKQYFGPCVEAEPYQNGRVDIKFNNLGNQRGKTIVECLRWTSYKNNKGKNSYLAKVKQVLGYRDIEERIFMLTFVQKHNIVEAVAKAKRLANSEGVMPINNPVDLRIVELENYQHAFTSRHSTTRGEVVIRHLFYDLFHEK